MWTELDSPDWSRGWICEEAHHELSKGLGGFGLSVWSGQAIARVAPSGLRLFSYTSGGGAVMTANGPMFTAAVTHSVTLTASTVSGISTIIGGGALIDNISTMMFMTGGKQPTTGLSQGGEFLDDALRTPDATTPFRDNSLAHIFRRKHNLPDTPGNRRLIQAVADDAANLAGMNQFGTKIFSRIQPDGSQIWVYVRDGKIFDAGRNLIPRTLP